jgi:3-dehydroquinate dehydratase-1
MNSKKKLESASRPLVVATAHTVRGLSDAGKLPPGTVDLVEIRLDCLLASRHAIASAVSRIPAPLLLTARHPVEGGAGNLSSSVRRSLYEEFLPLATAVDVELRSVGPMEPVLSSAAKRGVFSVISFHDFRGTPGLVRLREIVVAARQSGADFVKIATKLRGPKDLAVLLQLQSLFPSIALATMGMGPMGRVSRLALAAAGSRLNYGYLDRPQVSGQWEATQLCKRLEDVIP